MVMIMDDDDFYEDDEPLEKIRGDFAAGEKGVTVSRRDLDQRAASIAAEVVEASEPETGAPSEPVQALWDVESIHFENVSFGRSSPVECVAMISRPRSAEHRPQVITQLGRPCDSDVLKGAV